MMNAPSHISIYRVITIPCSFSWVCVGNIGLMLYSIVMYATIQLFSYPENVAYPFGGEGHRHFAVIQLHYDNPNMIQGKFNLYLI